MAIKYWLGGTQNWTTAVNWTGGTVPGATDDVTIYQGNPFATSQIYIRSLTVMSPGALDLQNAGTTNRVSGDVVNNGYLFLDRFGGQGGSKLRIVGTLVNTFFTQIGNSALSAANSITTDFINNTGTIEMQGSTQKSYLIVNDVAGFGTAGTVTGTVRLLGNSRISFTSGQITSLAANSYLRLVSANAGIVNATGNALTSLNTINRNATLMLNNGHALALTGSLTNYGSLLVDYFGGDGGASLSVAGKLYNVGYTQLGNGALSLASSLSVGTLTNQGIIEIDGTGTKTATLAVNSAASFGTAGALTGTVRLFGNSLITFASGQIKTLSNNSYLRLNGTNAFMAIAGQTTSNSALTTLATVGRNATLFLGNGNVLSTSNALTNYGTIGVDYFGGEGGSSMSLAGRLTNVGFVQIGNGALTAASTLSVTDVLNKGTIELYGAGTKKASLSVGGVAGFGTASTLTGAVRLFGNTLISFASGYIKTLAQGSYLRLNGTNAFIASGSNTTSNSALTGLTTVSRDAQFLLGNGASVAITGALVNYSTVAVDYFGGEGGASLSVAGALTNQGFVQVGNGALIADDNLTIGRLVNTGRIEIYGSNYNDGIHTDFTGKLIVNYAAGTGSNGYLNGDVYLQGHALLQFASGQIAVIDDGASLRINGANAFVANASNTTTNSALTGLGRVEGSLYLDNGATIATTGALTNYGNVMIDYFGGTSGSSMTVAGAFNNQNYLQIGNGSQSLADTLTVASLINDGSINITGGSARAALIVNSVARTGTTGHLTGSISLQGDALLQFASGQIDTIEAGAALRLNGAGAHVARAGSTSTNSALTGLTQNDGTLTLDNSASLTTSGPFTNYGTLNLDPYGGESNTSMTIGGAFTNEGTVTIGNGGQSLGEVLTAASLTNNGAINLYGNATGITPAYANLAIAGNVVNNGSIYLNNNIQTIGGNVTGFGGFNLANSSTLQLNGSVGSAQKFDLSTGADKLVLGNAKTFAGTIDDFGFGDKIDLTTFGAGTTFSYAQNAANTGGVLTVTNGANVANLNFDGIYSTANFTASSNGMGGTLFSYT